MMCSLLPLIGILTFLLLSDPAGVFNDAIEQVMSVSDTLPTLGLG
jgi:hypothetical protein